MFFVADRRRTDFDAKNPVILVRPVNGVRDRVPIPAADLGQVLGFLETGFAYL
jgi:hypothetical protein